jgi:hypothetical protein
MPMELASICASSKSNAHWEIQYQPRGAAPRTTRNGKIGYKVNYMGLGSAFVITLAEAREANRQANKLLIEKIDPLTTRRAERTQRLADAAKVITFGQAARDYYNAHARAWDDKHAAQWRQSVLGETPSGRPVKRDPLQGDTQSASGGNQQAECQGRARADMADTS